MNASFFTANRTALATIVSAPVIVLTAYDTLQRSADMAQRFEQESNFWYLTGIQEAGWRLVMDKEAGKSWLIAPGKDDIHRRFDGGLSFEQARLISGVDEVVGVTDGTARLNGLSKHSPVVATLGDDPYADHYDFTINPAQARLTLALQSQFDTVEDCRLPLATLRAIKQPVELTAMRRAIDVTTDAFMTIKQYLHTYEHEYQVEAAFSQYFRARGASGHYGHAYDPIVAAGQHACTLHYVQNDGKLTAGHFLLLDIGAKVDGYAADITRTYLLGTELTDRQRDIHTAVETAQRASIALLRPGLSVKAYHEQTDALMEHALQSVGLHTQTSDFRRYFPHAISHGLGIDVHDSLGRPEEFKAGMVLTVEPGIYVDAEGIGVRIEDDILITDTGYENLSARLETGW